MDELLAHINTLFEAGTPSMFELKRFERAAAAFTQRSATAAEGYMALGLLATLERNQEAMEDNFQKSRRLAPHDPLIWVNYAQAQHALGYALNALDSIRKALNLFDSPLIITRGVHIALSAIQIEQAIEWQDKLGSPLVSFPPGWPSEHLSLLTHLNISPRELAYYRDMIAQDLVKMGFLSDQSNLSFIDQGYLKYTFLLKTQSGIPLYQQDRGLLEWQNRAFEQENFIVVFDYFLE